MEDIVYNDQLHLETAYKNFFRDINIGFLKFKSKKRNHFGYTTKSQKGTIKIESGYIMFPKLKTPVKIKERRENNKISTIGKTLIEKYYIIINGKWKRKEKT